MKFDQLTITRFIAAVFIVLYHYGLEIYPFNLPLVSYLIKNANVAVSYFFILSGFVMILAYGQRTNVKIDILAYYKNRVARIYPLYFIAVVVCIPIVVFQDKQINLMYLTFHFLLLQSWFPHPLDYNIPGWSVSVEILFYLSFPFLFNKIYSRFSIKKLLPPVIILWTSCQVFFIVMLARDPSNSEPGAVRDFIFYFPALHFSEFVIGNIAGLILLRTGYNKIRNYDLMIIALIFCLMIFLLTDIGKMAHNGLLAIIFVPLIFFISLNNSWVSKLFSHKYFIYLGEISYGIYILHYPVFAYTKKGLEMLLHITDHNAIFFTSLLMLLAVSVLSFHLVEMPMRNKIKNIKFRPKENLFDVIE